MSMNDMPRWHGFVRAPSSWLAALLIGAAACAPASDESDQEARATAEAASELWTHPDTVGIEIYAPEDLKAASRDVAWGVDRIAAAIMRFEPLAGGFGTFGFLANEPPQVAAPRRIAVADDVGIAAFDDSTGFIDFYTPGGQHIRGFDPGVRPSVLEFSLNPLRLTLGVRTLGPDSVTALSVIQTDFLGQKQDTLLAPGIGSETLQGLRARGGMMMVSASESGLWLFSVEVPDTVFEISALGPGRKLILPESDPRRVGVLADMDEQLLWVVTPRAEGGLDYEAFDVSAVESNRVAEAAPLYLGARTTPVGFAPKVGVEGAIVGWWNVSGSKLTPRAYDMRVAELREEVEEAHAGRQARRDENERKWEVRLEAEAAAAAERAGEVSEEPVQE